MASSIELLNGPTGMQKGSSSIKVYPCTESGCNVILILYDEDKDVEPYRPFIADSCEGKHATFTLCCARHKATHKCIACRFVDRAEIAELEALLLKKKQKLNKKKYL